MNIRVETCVLVAVWDTPSIFQGCIKITELQKNHEVLYFFRCQSRHEKQHDVLDNDFSSDDYELTHWYDESGFIPLDNTDPIQEYALDMMKYALHVTLREMVSNRKTPAASIDDSAMRAMINKIRPLLHKELTLPEDEHIGFAVAMDFSPQEKMGYLAVLALLKKSDNNRSAH